MVGKYAKTGRQTDGRCGNGLHSRGNVCGWWVDGWMIQQICIILYEYMRFVCIASGNYKDLTYLQWTILIVYLLACLLACSLSIFPSFPFSPSPSLSFLPPTSSYLPPQWYPDLLPIILQGIDFQSIFDGPLKLFTSFVRATLLLLPPTESGIKSNLLALVPDYPISIRRCSAISFLVRGLLELETRRGFLLYVWRRISVLVCFQKLLMLLMLLLCSS